MTEKAKDLILDSTYSQNYGARIVKRYIQKNIETLIANEIIIKGAKKANSTLQFDNCDGEITIL